MFTQLIYCDLTKAPWPLAIWNHQLTVTLGTIMSAGQVVSVAPMASAASPDSGREFTEQSVRVRPREMMRMTMLRRCTECVRAVRALALTAQCAAAGW